MYRLPYCTIFVKGALDEYSCTFCVRTFRVLSHRAFTVKVRKPLRRTKYFRWQTAKYTECTCTVMTTHSAAFLAPQAWRGREGFLSMHFHVFISNKNAKFKFTFYAEAFSIKLYFVKSIGQSLASVIN